MAIVVYEGREVLIPLHEDLIVEADHEAQVVTMRLPEGLLEL
jgi:ribosomal 30S subunit maturation factor RimM